MGSAVNPKVENAINKLANKIHQTVLDYFSYNSPLVNNELKADIKQDVYLEYYTAKARLPDLGLEEILDMIEKNKFKLPSIPEPRLIPVEFLDDFKGDDTPHSS